VHAEVTAGLLALIGPAQAEGGWSLRKAATALGLDHVRVLRWLDRAAADRLVEAKPGPQVAARAAELAAGGDRQARRGGGEIDRSHRKLAHRGSRLGLV
jgi:putative transposase